MFPKISLLLMVLPSISGDDVCVHRYIATESTLRNGAAKETIVPGIYGLGMKTMMEIKEGKATRPIAILGDSRTDPDYPLSNDINPEFQATRQGASRSGWGVLRFSIGNHATAPTALPPYSRTEEAWNIWYNGVNDRRESSGGQEWVNFCETYVAAFKDLNRRFLKMEQRKTADNSISGRASCSGTDEDRWIEVPKGGACLIGVFGRNSSPCRTTGQTDLVYPYGHAVVMTESGNFKSNCMYSCHYACFWEEDPSPEDPFVIFSPPVPNDFAAFEPFHTQVHKPNVTPFSTYPNDGYDNMHGSISIRRWFGWIGEPGAVYNTTCITDAGNTNETEGVVRVHGYVGAKSGDCPKMVSHNLRNVEIPTQFATRHFSDDFTMARSERIPGWAMVLIGGIFGGPVGALMGFFASGGGGVSMKDVDMEIEKRINPALKTINDNFERQHEINNRIFTFEKETAREIRALSENQIQMQMEMSAMSLILNMVELGESYSKQLKEQLRTFAYKNNLKWDESTGCVHFEYDCDHECLDGIINNTMSQEADIDYSRGLNNFSVAELGPRSKMKLDFSVGSSITLLVLMVVFLIAGALVLYCLCCRGGGGMGFSGGGGKITNQIKV